MYNVTSPKTPATIISRLNAEVNAIAKDPAFRAQFDRGVMLDLRAMQRSFSAGLAVLATVGLAVLWLVWPYP